MLPLAILALACAHAPPSPPIVVNATPVAELDAKFQRTDGWVGGDGAFSVALSDQRTLWLFSDTWVGSIREGKRRGVVLVNNTVGVQDGTGIEAKLTFSIARGEGGKPRAMFVPTDGRGWFWLYAGIKAGDKLHVFLPRFEKTPDPGAFGFRPVDLWLGTVDNPGEAPADWTVNYAKLPHAEFARGHKQSFGSALVRVDDQIYIYGYDEKPGKPFPTRQLLIARVPADKLADFTAWQFLAAGQWKNSATDAAGLTAGLATEFSVSYLPDLKQYVLVYTEHGLSEKIVGRFSTTPVGPWSDPVLLFKCREMKQNKHVFTYAAKAHPQLASANELIISYVANGFDLGSVIDDADLYWPRFVRITLR